MHGWTYTQHFTETLASATRFSQCSWARGIKQSNCVLSNKADQSARVKTCQAALQKKKQTYRAFLLSEAVYRNVWHVWGERAAHQAHGSTAGLGFIPAALGGSGCLCLCSSWGCWSSSLSLGTQVPNTPATRRSTRVHPQRPSLAACSLLSVQEAESLQGKQSFNLRLF